MVKGLGDGGASAEYARELGRTTEPAATVGRLMRYRLVYILV